MSEPARGALRVEVVFALPDRQVLVAVELDPGGTVAQAIEKSSISDAFPDYDLSACQVGIWGQVVKRDHVLRDGDRVEIYRPLAIDPQKARRQLAAEGKSMGHAPDKPGRK